MLWFEYFPFSESTIDYRTIFDFGNGVETDNFVVDFKDNDIEIFIYGSQYSVQKMPIHFAKWTHLAVTYSNNNFFYFLDGIQLNTLTKSFNDIERTKNYIGASSWDQNGQKKIYATYDEMKIFDRALTVEEIAVEKDKAQPFDIIQF